MLSSLKQFTLQVILLQAQLAQQQQPLNIPPVTTAAPLKKEQHPADETTESPSPKRNGLQQASCSPKETNSQDETKSEQMEDNQAEANQPISNGVNGDAQPVMFLVVTNNALWKTAKNKATEQKCAIDT